MEIGKVVAQELRRSTGVGIVGWKDDGGIDRKPELHQLATLAIEQVGRKPGLLARHRADRNHLVHRRHVAEREHIRERRVRAHLTPFHRHARGGPRRPRHFCF
jgi:hypothetical protein